MVKIHISLTQFSTNLKGDLSIGSPRSCESKKTFKTYVVKKNDGYSSTDDDTTGDFVMRFLKRKPVASIVPGTSNSASKFQNRSVDLPKHQNEPQNIDVAKSPMQTNDAVQTSDTVLRKPPTLSSPIVVAKLNALALRASKHTSTSPGQSRKENEEPKSKAPPSRLPIPTTIVLQNKQSASTNAARRTEGLSQANRSGAQIQTLPSCLPKPEPLVLQNKRIAFTNATRCTEDLAQANQSGPKMQALPSCLSKPRPLVLQNKQSAFTNAKQCTEDPAQANQSGPKIQASSSRLSKPKVLPLQVNQSGFPCGAIHGSVPPNHQPTFAFPKPQQMYPVTFQMPATARPFSPDYDYSDQDDDTVSVIQSAISVRGKAKMFSNIFHYRERSIL